MGRCSPWRTEVKPFLDCRSKTSEHLSRKQQQSKTCERRSVHGKILTHSNLVSLTPKHGILRRVISINIPRKHATFTPKPSINNQDNSSDGYALTIPHIHMQTCLISELPVVQKHDRGSFESAIGSVGGNSYW